MNPSPSLPFERHLLANGLEVLISRDAELPVVTSMLWYRVGSAQESPGTTGMSHFLEHMLFKGSRRFAKGEIDSLTLRCGGSNNAFTWLDATTYYFSLPAACWELALEVEADRMQGALLDADELEAERQVILEEWQTARDDPDEHFWDSLNALALERHPYRYPVLGWPEDVKRLSRAGLEAHYRRYYHPNLATLVLVGDLPPDALERVEAHFGAIPAGPEPESASWSEPGHGGERRLWMPREDVQLPRLAVCWPAPALAHPDYAPLVLLHYLLSEGSSSRLYQALVEDSHLASDVSSMLFETRDPYLFWIQLDASEGKPADEIEAALFAEIERVAADGPTPAEFARIRNQLLTDHHLGQETCEDRAEYAGEIVSAGSWELLLEARNRLEAVSADDIRRVASEWLSPKNRTIGWIWPEGNETEAGEDEVAEDEQRPGGQMSGPGPRLHHSPAPLQTPPTVSRGEDPARRLLEHLPAIPALPTLRRQHGEALSLIHANPRTPTFSLVCWLPVGSHCDPAGAAGLANLSLASVFKGTRQRSARDFAEAIEALGANLSLSAGLSGVSIEVDALASQLEPVLELLQEALQQPALAETEIAKEKRLILSDLALGRESSAYQASLAFLAAVYAGSAAAAPVEGKRESVEALSPEAVRDFYARHYGPGLFCLAGDVDPGQADALIAKHFGAWAPARESAPPIPALSRQRDFSYRHIPLPGRDQCSLLLGHLGVPRAHQDFIPLLLLDVILGSGPGFAARIPRRLRDERGLAYSVNLSATSGCSLWPGVVEAQVETSPERALDCLRLILDEVRALQQDGVTADELAAAQAWLSGRFLFLFETNSQRSGFLLQRELYGWGENFLADYLTRLRAVTVDEIQAVAQRHLDTRNYTLISAGPRPHWKADQLHAL